MRPELQTGVTFKWRYPIPEHVTLHIKGDVIAVEGRRNELRVQAWAGLSQIAAGTHERMMILPERFNAKPAAKKIRRVA